MPKKLKLTHKLAVITGGSGGIGCSVAEMFLSDGAKVVIVAKNKLHVKRAVKRLAVRFGENVAGMSADVRNASQIEKLMRKIKRRWGGIDILVNAASLQEPIGLLSEVKVKAWEDNLRVNLIGTVLCCKFALPLIPKGKGGRIINFSGGGATFPRPYFSAYACAKAAVVRFTETLAQELRKDRITVNAIAPGPVNTRMLEEVLAAGLRAGKDELSVAQARKKQGGADPLLAAKLALFLASDQGKAITGKIISAVWDDLSTRQGIRKVQREASLFTLRRIDGKRFAEMKKCF